MLADLWDWLLLAFLSFSILASVLLSLFDGLMGIGLWLFTIMLEIKFL